MSPHIHETDPSHRVYKQSEPTSTAFTGSHIQVNILPSNAVNVNLTPSKHSPSPYAGYEPAGGAA